MHPRGFCVLERFQARAKREFSTNQYLMIHSKNSIACAIVVLTTARKFFGGNCLARGQSNTAANRFLHEVIQTDAIFEIRFEMAVASSSEVTWHA